MLQEQQQSVIYRLLPSRTKISECHTV